MPELAYDVFSPRRPTHFNFDDVALRSKHNRLPFLDDYADGEELAQRMIRVPTPKNGGPANDRELYEWLSELNHDGYVFFEETEQVVPTSRVMPLIDPKSPRVCLTNIFTGVKRERQPPIIDVNDAPILQHPRKLSKSGSEGQKKAITAMEVFLSFVRTVQTNLGPQIDCRGVFSRACFERWLETRQNVPSKPEECFRKSILAHITCSDGGSCPFPAPIETALLEILRETGSVWECFRGRFDQRGRPVKIGIKGLRCQGFHERESIKTRALQHEML
uniref:Uncharacterized protein n=1 Tax=Mucochytrium quahogii TaxID=96639 RepID=A0A7S2WH50_9STRA|mmetsp:Transcript_12840/g.20785  ORF Transcript_12840/g.20785 Transcript_12840/m.20785 type:complete len:276 (+) Transcript_12840:42-869(+)|eukprot:CAMPEP_0203762250 /NCGR_PEP_ID=MMETSP0098-20131031/15180_1 /ASSEMBLY_ACC=CAM_ASM_000208 /TAXON_ID=96639 /ORGANISM=" , Strain NY0313808BC1" /LENGTH=275 /DNA_ID=CAMNT_0050656589 /DNA_START=31 /DNA_END=858 /DNA_ORIENTATION=+